MQFGARAAGRVPASSNGDPDRRGSWASPPVTTRRASAPARAARVPGADGGHRAGRHRRPAVRLRARRCDGGRRDINNFRFNRDYHVDMILWREILGSVTDASTSSQAEVPGRPGFEASASAIYSRAIFDESAPGRRLRGQPREPRRRAQRRRALRDRRRVLRLSCSYGILFPLEGFKKGGAGSTAPPSPRPSSSTRRRSSGSRRHHVLRAACASPSPCWRVGRRSPAAASRRRRGLRSTSPPARAPRWSTPPTPAAPVAARGNGEPLPLPPRRAVRGGRAAVRASPRRSARPPTSTPRPRCAGTWALVQAAFAACRTGLCYSVKANCNLALLALRAMGRGLRHRLRRRARARARRPVAIRGKVVFTGVGKTRGRDGGRAAAGILMFNVESAEELAPWTRWGGAWASAAPFALRVNPDVDAKHAPLHRHRPEDLEVRRALRRGGALYRQSRRMKGLEARGVDCHIGSQLTDARPVQRGLTRVAGLYAELAAGPPAHHLDVGGGLGITYAEETAARPRGLRAARCCESREDPTPRWCWSRAACWWATPACCSRGCSTASRRPAKRFVIVDAGMNDLLRPALYEAHHDIVAAASRGGGAEDPWTSSARCASRPTCSAAAARWPAAGAGRPARGDERRRLRHEHGLHLQLPPPPGGGAGRGRGVPRRARARERSRTSGAASGPDLKSAHGDPHFKAR